MLGNRTVKVGVYRERQLLVQNADSPPKFLGVNGIKHIAFYTGASTPRQSRRTRQPSCLSSLRDCQEMFREYHAHPHKDKLRGACLLLVSR